MMKNVFRKINEMKEIVDCFFANADLEGDNVVLVNKNDRDEFMVLERDFKYSWSYDGGLAIHIVDGENNINIPINSVKEDEEDMDSLYINNYMLTVL